MSGTLFFDGNCGMCTRSVYALHDHRRRDDLEIAPFQRSGTAQRLGITDDQLTTAWWLDASGAVFRGAEAMNAAAGAAYGSRLPLRLYRIPGIRQLEDAVYRWVADHRYRFPGTTPHCSAHPGTC